MSAGLARSARPRDVAASRAVLVLGMHRSGTSAVAGALARCGVVLGDRLIEGAPDNPAGYFEHADAVQANERLLDALGRAWDDVRALPEGWEASDGAAEAAESIAADVLGPMEGIPTWAVKDPRMCRVLPLWLRLLDVAGVEPVGLLVLRHPDEVAASLARRDAMHPRTANLLWLRHMLDAACHAPLRTATLAYDAFVDDPAPCLAAVDDALDLGLAIAPEALDAFVDRGARHHRVATVAARDAVHALALDAHAALLGASWKDALPALQARLDAIDAEHRAWIDALGAASHGAERRRREATDARLEAERRAEHLQAAVDRATSLATGRVDELAGLDARNRALQEALGRAEELVASQTAELAGSQARLRQADEALSRAEALVATQASELAANDERLRAADAALSRAEALVATQASELAANDDRLREADAALARAEALVAARTAEAAALDGQLRASTDALARAEALALAHAGEAEALDRRLGDTDRALRRAEALMQERVAALEAAQSAAEAIAEERLRHLATLDQAFASVEALAIARLGEAEALQAELDDREARMHALHARVDTLQSELDHRECRVQELSVRVDALQASLATARNELARIRGSRLWPVYARLGRLGTDAPDE